jgi:hypothetical protein
MVSEVCKIGFALETIATVLGTRMATMWVGPLRRPPPFHLPVVTRWNQYEHRPC